MSKTVFFSWQSDRQPRTNRNFIKEVLEEVCVDLKSDTSIHEAHRELEVDSDTQGVAGQPPIVDTIFNKIDSCGVFVADMTYVGSRSDRRPSPNPNVLIEYGWALKSLGYNRIICIMNSAYGKPSDETLPFDLKHLRWPTTFSLSEAATAKEKNEEKNKLKKLLIARIRASLITIPSAKDDSSNQFQSIAPKDGLAKFREKGQPLGYEEDNFANSHRPVLLNETDAVLWLRLIPLKKGKEVVAHEIKDYIQRGNNISDFVPLMPGSGYSFIRAEDGYGIYRGSFEQQTNDLASLIIKTGGVVFIFETGELWSIEADSLNYHKGKIPYLEKSLIEGLQRYSKLLNDLGINPPHKWIVGVYGVKNRYLIYPPPAGYSQIDATPICLANSIVAEGQYDGKQNAASVLLPFFEKIFLKSGIKRPGYLPK